MHNPRQASQMPNHCQKEPEATHSFVEGKLNGPMTGKAKRQRTRKVTGNANEGVILLDHIPLKRPRLLGPVLAARFGYPKQDTAV